MEKVFESNNLYFVKVDESLINEYLDMMNDSDINKYLSFENRIFDYEDELLWIKGNSNNIKYSIIKKDTNEFVGNIEVLDIMDNIVSIGLVITKDKQNMHYGSEATKSFIDYCISNLGFKEIHLSIYSHNKRAINCVLKLGFVEYDRIKNIGNYNGNKVDDIYLKYKM